MVVVVCVVTSTAGVAAATSGAQGSTADAPDGTPPADLDAASAHADVDIDVEEPQTGDDFLAAFRRLSGQESLSAYSELEVIRTQAVVAVQSGSFDDADRERMRGVLRTLVRFDAAYAAAQNDSLTTSFESATATREAVSGLDSSGSTVYSSLASVALDRFFRSLGERFEQRSRADGISTPEQIDALQRAGEAYRLGGSSERFAEVSVEAEQLESAWARDSQEINESMAATQSFLDRCGATCGSPVNAVSTHTLGVFGLYTDARAASSASSDAVRIAEANNLGDRTTELQTVASDASDTLLSLAIGSALLLFAYAFVLAIPTMIVASRMSAWARDRRAASVGSVLSAMPREVYTDGGE
ncbi:hypothetical protein SAMN06265347_104190 [Halobellus salinus]|nr:hypothetical protein SAMN06265347_104190 [Halobellus salinus]